MADVISRRGAIVGSKDLFFQCYQKAQECLHHGRLQLALGYLQRSVDLNPKFYDAYYLLCEALRRLGRTGEALRVAEQLDKAVGFDPEVKLEIARLQCELKKYSSATRCLQEILRRHPQIAEAHFLMGEIYRAQGKTEQADESYSRCLERNPSHAGARRGINAMLRQSLDNADRRVEDRSTSAQRDVEHRLAAAARQIELGNLESAIASLKELLDQAPGHEAVVFALTYSLQRKGETQAALDVLGRYLESVPDSALAHYHCGVLLNRMRQYEEARTHLHQALCLDPDYYEAHFELGVTCHQSGDFQEAETAYARAIDLMPDDVRPRVNLAHLYLGQKHFDKAESLLRNVLADEPRCEEALYVLGNLYVQQKQFRRAQQCYEALLEQAPQHSGAVKRLALTKEALKDYRGALELWRQAACAQPADAVVQEHIMRLQDLIENRPGREEDQVFT